MMSRIPDNVPITASLLHGTEHTVEVPYYIFEDAVADDLTLPGVIVEVIEYIDEFTQWPPGTWVLTAGALDKIRLMLFEQFVERGKNG